MIYKFFKFLEKEKIAFIVLNGYKELENNKHPESDVDILFKRESFLNIEKIIKVFCKRENYQLVQIYHQEVWAKNIFLYDTSSGKILNLDTYGTLSRKKVFLFNENEIFENIKLHNKIPIPIDHQEFIYYLVKKIDKKDLTKESFNHLRDLYDKSNRKCDQHLKTYFPSTHDLISKAFKENEYSLSIAKNYKILINDFKSKKTFRVLFFVKNVARILKRISKPTGLCISFLGPDGAGKSTIIKAIEEHIEFNLPFRRSDYFHLKPKYIKNSEKAITVSDPHEKEVYSRLKSYMKLVYFVFQYNLGWIKNIVPLKIKSSLVIFDRYFDDLLIDNKRYRYGGSLGIAKLVRRIIPKPDIYIVLTAEPKVIYGRKKEVPFEELEKQIKLYQKMCDGEKYFNINVDRSPEEIVDEVIFVIMQKMQKRHRNF